MDAVLLNGNKHRSTVHRLGILDLLHSNAIHFFSLPRYKNSNAFDTLSWIAHKLRTNSKWFCLFGILSAHKILNRYGFVGWFIFKFNSTLIYQNIYFIIFIYFLIEKHFHSFIQKTTHQQLFMLEPVEPNFFSMELCKISLNSKSNKSSCIPRCLRF